MILLIIEWNGTFGGWRIGNKLKKIEETDELLYTYRSYNPEKWTKYWKEYQQLSYQYSKLGYKYIAKLDIANFYDNINLNILETKLFLTVTDKEKWEYIKLLMFILQYWNKKIDSYNAKTVGIPQCEFGEQSRLLANFYLQDFDEKIKEICDKLSAKYLRYADDQEIFANTLDDLKYIIYNIALELNKLGLNLNASKVSIFSSEEFNEYWAFDIMNLLDNNTEKSINEAIDIFIKSIKSNKNFRSDIVLRRILNNHMQSLKLEYKFEILKEITSKKFITTNNTYYMNKTYEILNEDERKIYLKTLEEIFFESYYNSNLYEILNFYKKNKIPYDETKYLKRIKELTIE